MIHFPAVPPMIEHAAPASSSSELSAGLDSDRSQEPEMAPTALMLTESIMPIVPPAGLDNDRSKEPVMAPTALMLAESIVPIINFGKVLGLSLRSSGSTMTTVSPVSTEHTMKRAWVSLEDLRAYSTTTNSNSKPTGSDIGGVLPVSPDSSMAHFSPLTMEETVEQARGSLDDPQAPFTLLPPRHAESTAEGSTVTTVTTLEPLKAPTENPRAPPEKPTSSSEVWHYCKQCSQWHG